MIKLMFFGRFTDIAASRDSELPIEISTVKDLAAWLGKDDDPLRHALAQKGVRVAVNQVMTDFDAPVVDGDEVAFMSALSGG